jgi:hypothetical protein
MAGKIERCICGSLNVNPPEACPDVSADVLRRVTSLIQVSAPAAVGEGRAGLSWAPVEASFAGDASKLGEARAPPRGERRCSRPRRGQDTISFSDLLTVPRFRVLAWETK